MMRQTVLKTLRERAGLSQGGLAAVVGSAQPRMSVWETGEQPIPAGRAEQLAEFLRTALPYPRLVAGDLQEAWDDVLELWRKADRRRSPEKSAPK